MMNKLNEIPAKNPFKVPENYFEEINSKIISATSGYEKEVRKIGFYNRFRPYLLVAASVAGLVILSLVAVTLLSPDRTIIQVSEVINKENSELYLNDIDILTLEENVAPMILSQEDSEVNKADIVDYLLQENIEISDIYDKL
jgi:hypothetical protein